MEDEPRSLADLVVAIGTPAAVVGSDGTVVTCNDAWERERPLCGLILDEIVHRRAEAIDELLDARPRLGVRFRRIIADGGHDVFDWRVPGDRSQREIEVRLGATGTAGRVLVMWSPHVDEIDLRCRDVERNRLTGLPGPGLFQNLVHRAIVERQLDTPAVMLIELGGLADLSRERGVELADEVTRSVATRLKACVRGRDAIGHSAEHELAVLLPDVGGPYIAEMVAHRLITELSRPIASSGGTFAIAPTLGVAIVDAAVEPAEALAIAAEELDRARERRMPRVSVATVTSRLEQRECPVGDRLRLDLSALDVVDLVPHFQPIVDIATHTVVGAEALLRWAHPEHGIVHTADFFGAALGGGLVPRIAELALSASIEAWSAARGLFPHPPPHLLLNVGPDQLVVRGAIEHLCRLLDEGDIPTEEVVLEVTEEAVQGGDLLAVLNRARSLGMRVALDDFGSGHSSLGRLRDLPVDLIKIDRSLVRGVDLDRHARQILRSIEQMATRLDIECVVEGVESAAEAGAVAEQGFRYLQGYHLGRAMPARDLVERALRGWRTTGIVTTA